MKKVTLFHNFAVILGHGVMVITGGPGPGRYKTSTSRCSAIRRDRRKTKTMQNALLFVRQVARILHFPMAHRQIVVRTPPATS
jgi:hypothetical protein